MSFYDINGNEVANSALNEFIDNMDFDYEFDSDSDANYTVMRIYQTKIDGTSGIRLSLRLMGLEQERRVRLI